MEQKIGGLIAAAVFAVVGLFLFFNWTSPDGNLKRVSPGKVSGAGDSAGGGASTADFTEYPIGAEERHGMEIVAVWLPPVQMEGMDLPQDQNVIHLEADIHALEGNVNGFGKGAWIPYLKVEYEIHPLDSGKETIVGEFMPMVAKDGPHYGATITMPGLGKYRLVYKLEPPSVNGFGRHSDPITGVGPWWPPFSVEFPFDYRVDEASGDASASSAS